MTTQTRFSHLRKLGGMLFAMTLLLLAGCASNPVSGQKDFVLMSEADEIGLGRSANADVLKRYKAYESQSLQDYVNSVGQRIARQSHRPNLQYHFTVLDTPEINAFALPGGYVYITRGILAYLNSEAELAAVLGHEIGHVTARHGVRQSSAAQVANIGVAIASILLPEVGSSNLGQNLSQALLSGYGREHELEADRLGAEYLARTEYDPQAMIRVISVLKQQELFDEKLAKQEGRQPRRYHGLFATHPDNDTRLKQAVGASSHLVVAKPREGYTDFLRHVDGLVFNDSGDQGVVRNNKFMHAEIGIALTFPPDWHVQNQPDKLFALSPQANAIIQLRMQDHPSGSPEDFTQRLVGSAYTVESRSINHLPAAIATLPAATAGVIYLDDKAYILEGKAQSPEIFDSWRRDMLDTIKSFHAMGVAEREQARPLSITLIKPRAGDTYAELARRSPLGKQAESYLRLINGDYPQGEPRPGQLVKVVE
jgi:predicted Zn-dependent protease